MTTYTPTYDSGDLTAITVDAIAEGGVALLGVVGLVVLSIILGILAVMFVRLGRATRGR